MHNKGIQSLLLLGTPANTKKTKTFSYISINIFGNVTPEFRELGVSDISSPFLSNEVSLLVDLREV